MDKQVRLRKSNGKEAGDAVRSVIQWLMEAGRRLGEWAKRGWSGLKRLAKRIGRGLVTLKRNFLRSFAAWADPRLEPYRECRLGTQPERPIEQEVIVEESTYIAPEAKAPETREDLLALVREAPMSVLSSQERKAMAAVLELPETQVAEVMIPVGRMVFVKHDEALGPLVLDRLYRSGWTYFPVVDARQHIIGMLGTAYLNSLDVREIHTAEEIMEPRVYFVRMDYSLEQTLKAFLRTGSQTMLVIDRYEKLVGMLTFSQVMDFLFDQKFRDEFDRDDDRTAVAKRKN